MKSICNVIIIALMTRVLGAEIETLLPKMVEVEKAVAESTPEVLIRTSADFEKALKEAPLSPSPNVRVEIIAVRDASSRLLVKLGEGKFPKDSGEAKAVATAIKSTLNKLDSLIEENYEWKRGNANISPPPVTSNAAAGMNPLAISDPKLRQQYLDSIDKEKITQEKNVQQQELKSAREQILKRLAALDSWRTAASVSKQELIEAFTNEGKSRELLREIVSPLTPR